MKRKRLGMVRPLSRRSRFMKMVPGFLGALLGRGPMQKQHQVTAPSQQQAAVAISKAQARFNELTPGKGSPEMLRGLANPLLMATRHETNKLAKDLEEYSYTKGIRPKNHENFELKAQILELIKQRQVTSYPQLFELLSEYAKQRRLPFSEDIYQDTIARLFDREEQIRLTEVFDSMEKEKRRSLPNV